MFFVPIKHHCKLSIIDFLKRFIRTVFISDSVFYLIGAVELIKFQNKIDQHDINVQEKAELDNLRKSIFSLGVIILENDEIFDHSTSDNELDIAMLRNKDEDKYCINDEEFCCKSGSDYISAVLVLYSEDDVLIANERILERWKKELGIETSDKSTPSLNMLIKFCLGKILLHNIYNFIL